jgi:hypothetical protein
MRVLGFFAFVHTLAFSFSHPSFSLANILHYRQTRFVGFSWSIVQQSRLSVFQQFFGDFLVSFGFGPGPSGGGPGVPGCISGPGGGPGGPSGPGGPPMWGGGGPGWPQPMGKLGSSTMPIWGGGGPMAWKRYKHGLIYIFYFFYGIWNIQPLIIQSKTIAYCKSNCINSLYSVVPEQLLLYRGYQNTPK